MNYASFQTTLNPYELDQYWQLAANGTNYQAFQYLIDSCFTGDFTLANWTGVVTKLLAIEVIDQTRADTLIAAWTADNPNQPIVMSN